MLALPYPAHAADALRSLAVAAEIPVVVDGAKPIMRVYGGYVELFTPRLPKLDANRILSGLADPTQFLWRHHNGLTYRTVMGTLLGQRFHLISYAARRGEVTL